MTEPASFDPKRTPPIAWNAKQWPIPPLVADQLDMVWDDIIELTKVLFAQDKDAKRQEGEEADATALRRGMQVVNKRYELTREQYGKLCDVVYYGLTRAHPGLTREEFRAVPATSLEMLSAFFVVRRQSGIYGDFESKPIVSEPVPTGEALAAESPSQTSNI